MSLASAFNPINEANYRMVQHQTWGHLFPANMVEPVKGRIRVAYGNYGDFIVLDDDVPIDSSPWWFDTLMAFVSDFAMESGEVIELNVQVHMRTIIHDIPFMEDFLDGEKIEYVQKLEIELLSKQRVLKPLI